MSRAGRALLRHGLSYTPEYRAWQTMRHRCLEPTSPAWKDYGGRGITMFGGWVNDPAAFIAHIGKRPGPRYEVDREDNDLGYVPGNVRWVIRPVNCRNRRSNHKLTYKGETRTLVEWAARIGLSPTTLLKRVEAGWSTRRAIETPLMRRGPLRRDARIPTPTLKAKP